MPLGFCWGSSATRDSLDLAGQGLESDSRPLAGMSDFEVVSGFL